MSNDFADGLPEMNDEQKKEIRNSTIIIKELFPRETCQEVTEERFMFWYVDTALWKGFYRQHPENIAHDSVENMYKSSRHISDHIPACGVCTRRYEALETIGALLKTDKSES